MYWTQNDILSDNGFGFLDHVRFDIGALEHGLDNQIDIFEHSVVTRRRDAGEELISFFLCHPSARDALVEDLLGIGD